MNKFILGGWSQSLKHPPLPEFDVMMYGMVTNLEGLTTGSVQQPGWSPEKEKRPADAEGFTGKTLWVYGGGGCSPDGKPADLQEVARLVQATRQQGWDGVDFDDECNMNVPLVTEAMRQLKAAGKETSFGFIAGYSWNHPNTESGRKLAEKITALATSGQCDRLIHYCYAAAMWSKDDIIGNVIPAIKRTLSILPESKKSILALTSKGLTDWSLNYFIDQVLDFNLGGLFIWRYEELTDAQRKIIKDRLWK